MKHAIALEYRVSPQPTRLDLAHRPQQRRERRTRCCEEKALRKADRSNFLQALDRVLIKLTLE